MSRGLVRLAQVFAGACVVLLAGCVPEGGPVSMDRFYAQRDAYIDCLFDAFIAQDLRAGAEETKRVRYPLGHSVVKASIAACAMQREAVRMYFETDAIDWFVNEIDDKVGARMYFMMRDMAI